MSDVALRVGILLFAVWFHMTESMVYHLALLHRHGDISQFENIVGEIHYQGGPSGSSEPKMTNEVGCAMKMENAAGNIKKMSLPKDDCVRLLPKAVSIAATGFKIESENDIILHVYQSNNTGTLADGYLAIPDEDLGTEYYVTTYCSTGGYCQFAVTGTEDSTSINVVFPQHIPTGSVTCNGKSISSGEPMPIKLNENEVLHIESTDSKVDLSGTYITSDKKVAVFIGARDIPGNDGTSAFMIEQVPPVNKWGIEHVVAPNYLNDAGDIVKIITKDVDTTIHILRDSPFQISNAGESIEKRIDWELHSSIISSKPILVIQIMSLDLYNDTSIVNGNPAVVLIPHIQQWTSQDLWTDCLQKATNKSLLTMTAKTDELATFPWDPPTDPQFTRRTDVNGSEYSVLSVRSGNPETTERKSYGQKLRALYGYCDGKSAILYHVNWQWENEECVQSSPVPGDGIDNDCDGKIDEDTCTQNDLAVSFSSSQDLNTFRATIKTLNIKKASPIRFSLKTCAIAKITLKSTKEPIVTTSFQITKSNVVLQTCSPVCQVQQNLPISVQNCNEVQKYKFAWKETLDGTRHMFKRMSGVESFNFTINGPNIEYEQMYLTSFAGTADYVVDLPEKDCSKVKSGGGADNHGFKFLAPFIDASGYQIHLTNPYSTTASVEFFKASDMTRVHSVTVPSKTTVLTIDSHVNNEKVLLIESDNEISVYATKKSSSGKNTGFPILPLDILGPNYNIYADSTLTADASPSTTNICMGYSLYEQTESNIGDVNEEIAITKGIYDTELGHQKRFTSNRPTAVFCGAYDSLAQMPPIETLGTQYYIPPITFTETTETAEIHLVAIEDSTVVIIRGNYDNLDTIELTGDIFVRKIVTDMVYNITSTKPIQVHLLLRPLISSRTWASLVTIPPVEQYKTNHVFPSTLSQMGIGVYKTAVDEDGKSLHAKGDFESLTSGGPVKELVYPSKAFVLFITVRTDGNNIIAGDMGYADINKVCNVTKGSPGDGIDNDCDGLIDEEQCSVIIAPGEIDDDVDGDLNKDCAGGTTPFIAPPLNLGLTSQSVTCSVSSSSNAVVDTGNDVSIGNTGSDYVTINNGFINSNPSSSIPNKEPPGSPPTYSPISASASTSFLIPTPASQVSSNSTNTTDENCVDDCACPCGWVNPKNYTKKELETIIVEIQEKLKVTKRTLSSVIRSKSSAKDDRTEATAVGIAGIIFIVVLLGAVILLDLTTIARDFRLMMGNLRQVFQP